jgi:hypothetical protein
MGLGSVSINNTCVELIRSLISDGSTILEFGSGHGTVVLSEFFKLYSVENQREWQNKFPLCTTYINCSTKVYDQQWTCPAGLSDKGWYNPDELLPNLPESYDLILIDGPGGWLGRAGFLKYIDYFNTDVPIIFDDVNRDADFRHMELVSKHLNRPYEILPNDRAIGFIR